VLKNHVRSCLEGYEAQHHVGPLALYFTLVEIAFCNTKTVDSLSAALAKVDLNSLTNNSTAKHACIWQQMMTFLRIYNKVPVNATSLILELYTKCSVAAFCQHFFTLTSIQHPCLNNISTLLMEGQNTERRLKSEGHWNPTKKQGAVFLGAANKKQPNDNPNSGDTVPKPPKKPPMHDRHGNPIDCHPPKNGKSHQCTNSLTGREEQWCGNPKCQRWGSHETQGHAEWFEKLSTKCNKSKNKDHKDKDKNKDKSDRKGNPPPQPTLQIPRANFAETIGNGFTAPF